MTTLMIAVFVIALAGLLLVSAMHPKKPVMSHFELSRRAQAGDNEAGQQLVREEYGSDVTAILRIVGALLLVATILTSVSAFGWLFGSIGGVIIVCLYGSVARLGALRHIAQQLYGAIEPSLMAFVQRYPRVVAFLRDYVPSQPSELRIHSSEELLHLVEQSNDALSADERRLVMHGLTFGARLVSEVMTPRSVIDTVASDELLGPLTLDTLYKTGHSRLPVIKGDIDHVVGVLYMQDLLVATNKKTITAVQAMNPRVFYIREDHTLQHALSAFLRTHHHLFIVVNEYRETVGVLSLEDVVEALIGRKIIDEFDEYDDLRAVAARNPRSNNRPEARTDV